MKPRESKQPGRKESFVKSRGLGSIQLKCEACVEELPRQGTLKFKLGVGSGELRGPIAHDFVHQGSVASLPLQKQEWNFREAVDAASQTFTVYLEVECACE